MASLWWGFVEIELTYNTEHILKSLWFDRLWHYVYSYETTTTKIMKLCIIPQRSLMPWKILPSLIDPYPPYILFLSDFFSLSMIILRFIHKAAWIHSSHYWVYFTVWLLHPLLIYSLADGHLGWFLLLAVANKAAANIHVQLFGTNGWYRVCMLNILRNCPTAF